ncbi:MAG: NADH-quinone oxidoreductase subunit N [Dehalococcoidales bacterium]|nr:NADH-quinone oxidoreductase subunit N [Dehalococcoidales bacterium]
MLNLGLFIPELTLAIFAILIVMLDLFIKPKDILRSVALSGLVVAGVISMAMWENNYAAIFNNMLAVDNFAVFFKLLFIVVAFFIILASADYVSKFARFQGEYYALVLLSTLGMMLMAATTDLISNYLALELTSLSFCSLICLLKEQKSTEAALKYLLLSAIASATLLYGMALVFGFTGRTQLAEIARSLQAMPPQTLLASPALLLGIVLMIAGFGYKMAAVPFQMWVPDVYEGAPTTITAYLSVASKAAGFALVLRVFFSAFALPAWLAQNWGAVFAALAILSMTVGNIAAIPQTNIKRMLGYSSIAQAGYLMVGLATLGFASSDVLGRSGVLFFLTSYAFTNIGAFIAIIAISNRLGNDEIANYSGIGKKAPLMALALTLCLVSLIGMPPAAGFMAKFYIFRAAVMHNLLWLVIIAVINSVISAYYYLRVVKVMWFGEAAAVDTVPATGGLKLALTLCCLGVLLIGIVPGQFMSFAELAARMFGY